jgi:hypothetical protein
MSITPEEQLRLSACIQEIAQIKNKNTDSEDRATLEGLEKVVRPQMLEYVSPKIALFLSKKSLKLSRGPKRTLNRGVGQLKITQKQANRLGVESYSRRSPVLEKCCLLLSAERVISKCWA